MTRLARLLTGALFIACLSQAAIVVNFRGTEAGPNGTWFVYDVDIGTDTTVRQNNDYFVIYDFGICLADRCCPPAGA